MRSTPLLFRHLAAALIASGAVTVQAADGRFYDPSNRASPTGMTTGYTLYRTIGCPARELLGIPCVVTDFATAPVAPAASVTATQSAQIVSEPALVVVPTPARTEQYCAILDFQFEIDQDEIQREEKEKLAALGAFLTLHPDSFALIEGHTDDVGTSEYNMALSWRRADSVVGYLEKILHIPPARMSAVGYGETRPLVPNDSELGKRMNRRIDAVIACVTDVAGLTVLPARLTMALQIEFDRNKADLKPEYNAELSKVANLMRAKPRLTATLEGHTANLQATPELAMEISRQRAQNVVNALVDNYGIARSRLAVEGFGETRRVAYNTSLEGQQENRRVNIIFNYPK
jgi:OOP family OmpA-OmpF porin